MRYTATFAALAITALAACDGTMHQPSEPTHCVATAPKCTGAGCGNCVDHAECASDACLDTGSCAAEADVAYVDSTGNDNAVCSQPQPCLHVEDAVATGRPYVKLHGALSGAVAVDSGRQLTLLADPGTTLSSDGTAITVRGDGTELNIRDLQIVGTPVGGGPAISAPPDAENPSLSLVHVTVLSHAGGAISFEEGSIEISQSVIINNAGGGIFVGGDDTAFSIVGNAFIANGSPSSATGAIAIATAAKAGDRLDFNTLYNNLAQAGRASGIECAATGFTARNNILVTSWTAGDQVDGACLYEYSFVTSGAMPTGTGNQSNDPMFQDPAHNNLRLKTGSPASTAARGSSLDGPAALDIDDRPRISPASVGAYQVAANTTGRAL